MIEKNVYTTDTTGFVPYSEEDELKEECGIPYGKGLVKNIRFCDTCFSGNYPTPIPKYEQEDIENEIEIRKSPKFTIC